MRKFSWLIIMLMLIPSPAAQGGEESLVPVTTRPLPELLHYPQSQAPATVISLNDAQLGAEVPGVVGELMVDVGARVAKGELLVSLDMWEHRLAVRQAEAGLATLNAQLTLARKQAERASVLRQKDQASAELLDSRATEVASLSAQIAQQQANLDTVRQRLDKGVLKAPFAGVVVERRAQQGQWVNPGEPLLRLVDLEHLELVAQLDPQEADTLAQARELAFQHPGGAYPLTLRVVLPWGREPDRTREARLTFTNARPLPGTAGRLTWSDPRPHLPAWLLVRRGEHLGVFLAQGDKAVFHALPEAREGQPAVVSGELAGMVIVDGREGLSPGARVRVGGP